MGDSMIEREFIIENEHGLQARPASLFCNKAVKYKSKISVKREGNPMVANGKSVISLLMIEVYSGSKIRIIAEGEDEEQAIEGISELIKSNFNE